jgi:hypothetical protein
VGWQIRGQHWDDCPGSLERLIFRVGRSSRLLFESIALAVMAARKCLPCEGKEQPVRSISLTRCCIGHLRGGFCLGSVVANDHAHWRGPCWGVDEAEAPPSADRVAYPPEDYAVAQQIR